MTAPSETPGAAPCCSGPSPARNLGELLAALERERVRDPDALQAERAAPESTEHIAGARQPLAPISQKRAARNRARLADAARDADLRCRGAHPALAPINRTPLQSSTPAAPRVGRALTGTNGQEVA